MQWKLLNKDKLLTNIDIVSIKREKYILKILKNNPFVINIRTTFQDRNNLYFITEHWVGGDLEKIY